MQLQHVASKALLLRLLMLSMALLLYPAPLHHNLAFNGLAKAAMVFWGHCAGVLARLALMSLPALRWRHCQHHAVVVASIAPAYHVGFLRSGQCSIALASLPALR